MIVLFRYLPADRDLEITDLQITVFETLMTAIERIPDHRRPEFLTSVLSQSITNFEPSDDHLHNVDTMVELVLERNPRLLLTTQQSIIDATRRIVATL